LLLIPEILHNEQELIQLISKGDENAFIKIYNFYHNRIYGIALKLTRSTTIAEEIVEEVFLKIWLKSASLSEVQNFQAYLFTITRNHVFKVLRQIAKNYKIVLLQENDLSLSHNNSEDYILEKENNSLLNKAIDRLPKQQKEVYTLIKDQGLKREEAAEFLHLKPETVKFHLAQAMKNIRSFCAIHIDLIVIISFLFFGSE